MTLPKKKSRTIEVDGVNYRWMIGKERNAPHPESNRHTAYYADIIVETPDGTILKHEAMIGTQAFLDDESRDLPMTPAMVRTFIRSRLGA